MKKLLVISLVLALVLTMVLPSVAMAAGPSTKLFNASGTMNSIDNGNVKQIGHSAKWIVKDRHITGDFSDSSSVSGPFTITYEGIFDINTQAGSFVGKMEAGSADFVVSGKTDPFTIVGQTPVPDGAGGYIMAPLCKLTLNGDWIGIRGQKASGKFNAYMVFIPTTDGHVAAIVDSVFNMTGKYNK